MKEHIVQSEEWGRFKTEYGTKAYRVSGVQYTIHKIPLTNFYYAYAPKVSNFDIDWDELKNSLKKNNCIAINFDTPNVLKGAEEAEDALKILSEKCVRSPRNTFAKHNIYLDISLPEKTLMNNMHSKHRYNIRYAKRKGVTAEVAESMEEFNMFYDLMLDTAKRQKYFIHSREYYEKIWKILHPMDMCHIVYTKFEDEVLAAWMLFTYQGVLYYPYGGSSEKHRNLYGSNLTAWEAILLGKNMGCKLFDMWGAAPDPDDENHPWHGFTNFKMKFGGEHVEYIDSHDFVINKTMYTMFNLANVIRWKILSILK